MFPTTAEQIQTTIIESQSKDGFFTPKKLVKKRHSQQFKLKDHSPDFFYERNGTDEYKYRRCRDSQKTQESQLVRSPGKFTLNHQRVMTQMSPAKGEGFFIHNKKTNSSQNQKIFHTSHVFDEYQEYPKHNYENICKAENSIKNPEQFQPSEPSLEEEDKFFLPKNVQRYASNKLFLFKYRKSPVGALANKLYNSKLQQFPEQDKNEQLNFEIEGNPKIDEVEIRRKLALKGYQIIMVQLPFQPLSNLKAVNGKIEVRVYEKNKDKNIVMNEIKSMGFLVKNVKEYYPVNADKQQKTWIKQKVNYKNIGFFPNRDSDKLKFNPNSTTSTGRIDFATKNGSNFNASTRQPLGNELHKILIAK